MDAFLACSKVCTFGIAVWGSTSKIARRIWFARLIPSWLLRTTMLPKAGDWRLFLQFRTAGVLHTAAVTLPVG